MLSHFIDHHYCSVCDLCGKKILLTEGMFEDGFMLKSEIWKKVCEHLNISEDKFLCYDCVVKTLLEMDIDLFDAIVDCGWNSLLMHRAFLETEGFEYVYLSKSKRHRLWWIPGKEDHEEARPFKIDFSSKHDILEFADWLYEKLYKNKDNVSSSSTSI